MKYEWDIDIFFAVNFLMDSAGLLACAVICSRRVRLIRILAVSAATAAACSVLPLLLHRYMLYRLLVHVLLNPLMILLAFRPAGRTEWLREYLCVYLVFFAAGGVQEWVCLQTLRRNPAQILVSGGVCMVCFTIWQIRRRVVRWICAVELCYGGEKIRLEAYCDSGNVLRDPLDHAAVSVVTEDRIPEKWKAGQEERRIPYQTLNCKTAWMPVIILDQMNIYRKGRMRQIERPKIGLQKETLMQSADVQMILHSSLFE